MGALILVAAYVGMVGLYANAGMGQPRQITQSRPGPDSTTVTVGLKEVHTINYIYC
ncbi:MULTISPECIES: hypothetical protein [unclassified Mycobacterium]|uniref:hypothetical protein n=1 Tax=unclassified Mycobacterium TaxID=2642494 RepID=UPI0012E957B8|nr:MULTISPECIES: hypothetical protein [unclassified Mycobacterium]